MALSQRLRLWRPDPLIALILLAVALAIIAPARGDFAGGLSVATKIAIGLLFFLYGARLSTHDAVQGVENWRLHSTILGFTYLVFPLLGLVLYPLQGLIGQELYLGLLFMTLVPSTVQSSVAFTSIARGNVAGAIVSASASNIVGVIATPLLVMLLMRSDHLTVSGAVFGDIAVQLLLPFVLGQFVRRWVGELARKSLTRYVDRLSIALVVYAAFSEGIVQGIWTRISPWQVLFLVLLSVALVEFLLWFSGVMAKKLGFDDGDRVALQFCGSKKSLATGLPMAAVIFGGGAVGALILPLMVFHQVQLMVCAAKAARWGRQAEAS